MVFHRISYWGRARIPRINSLCVERVSAQGLFEGVYRIVGKWLMNFLGGEAASTLGTSTLGTSTLGAHLSTHYE